MCGRRLPSKIIHHLHHLHYASSLNYSLFSFNQHHTKHSFLSIPKHELSLSSSPFHSRRLPRRPPPPSTATTEKEALWLPSSSSSPSHPISRLPLAPPFCALGLASPARPTDKSAAVGESPTRGLSLSLHRHHHQICYSLFPSPSSFLLLLGDPDVFRRVRWRCMVSLFVLVVFRTKPHSNFMFSLLCFSLVAISASHLGGRFPATASFMEAFKFGFTHR